MRRNPLVTWMPAIVTGGLVAAFVAMPAPSDAQAATGSVLFKTYCASCHGQTGRGNGPVAIFLRVPPADLTEIAKRNKGVFPKEQIYRIIDGRQTVKTHGDSQMPVWGDAFAKSIAGADEKAIVEKIRALVDFLETIQARPAE